MHVCVVHIRKRRHESEQKSPAIRAVCLCVSDPLWMGGWIKTSHHQPTTTTTTATSEM
jgi:hypothetical protein